jgi:uncharacterized membrane protein YdbT with pleckstrin-like domain
MVSELASYKEKAAIFRQLADERQAEIECLQVKVSEVEDERNDLRMRVYIETVKHEERRNAAHDRAKVAEENSDIWQKKCEKLEKEIASVLLLVQASEKRTALAEAERQLSATKLQQLEEQIELSKLKSKRKSRFPTVASIAQIMLFAIVVLVWLLSLVQSSRENYVGM